MKTVERTRGRERQRTNWSHQRRSERYPVSRAHI